MCQLTTKKNLQEGTNKGESSIFMTFSLRADQNLVLYEMTKTDKRPIVCFSVLKESEDRVSQ